MKKIISSILFLLFLIEAGAYAVKQERLDAQRAASVNKAGDSQYAQTYNPLLLKAAEQGNAGAQDNLGWVYHGGAGIGKDDKQAAAWWRKAAEQGHAKGQTDLGNAYHYGWGLEKDDKQAVIWWRKAAEQGYPSAQEALKKYAP